MSYQDTAITSVVAVGCVFLGLKTGVWVSDRKEKKRKKEELDKIHFLINADFTYINRLLTIGINHHKEWQDFIKKEDWFTANLSLNANLQQFLIEIHHKIGGFTYWDSLVSSGSLIKLEPDELRLVIMSHNHITEVLNITNASHKRLVDNIIKCINTNDKTPKQKVQEIQHECDLYLYGLAETYDHIKDRIQKTQNGIKWIDLTAEPIKLQEKDFTPMSNTEKPVS